MDSPKVELTQPELNIKISESKLKMTQPLGPVWNKDVEHTVSGTAQATPAA